MITPGMHDFAFQTGTWQGAHRKLRKRLVGNSEWYEFSSTCRAWEIFGGAGNVEDQWLDDPSGAYAAASVRRTDPVTGRWSIWWIDLRAPGIDPPVHREFADGVGTFRGSDTLAETPIEVRFIWSGITKGLAR